MLDRKNLIAQARAEGFDLCGIARAERHPKLARLAEWITAGRAGDMHYLEHSLDERADPSRVLPSVKSIVSVAVVYNTSAPEAPSRVTPGATTTTTCFVLACGSC